MTLVIVPFHESAFERVTGQFLATARPSDQLCWIDAPEGIGREDRIISQKPVGGRSRALNEAWSRHRQAHDRLLIADEQLTLSEGWSSAVGVLEEGVVGLDDGDGAVRPIYRLSARFIVLGRDYIEKRGSLDGPGEVLSTQAAYPKGTGKREICRLAIARGAYSYRRIEAIGRHKTADEFRSWSSEPDLGIYLARLPRIVAAGPHQPPVAIYTANYGPRDQMDLSCPVKEVPLHWFTDQKPQKTGPWNVHVEPARSASSKMASAHYRVLPENALPNVRFAIWLDAALRVTCPIVADLFLACLGSEGLAVLRHNERSNIDAEAVAAMRLRADCLLQDLPRVARTYRAEGYDRQELYCGGISIRDTRNERVRKLDQIWQEEVVANTPFDQLGFAYAMWKADVRPVAMPWHAIHNDIFRHEWKRGPIAHEPRAPDGLLAAYAAEKAKSEEAAASLRRLTMLALDVDHISISVGRPGPLSALLAAQRPRLICYGASYGTAADFGPLCGKTWLSFSPQSAFEKEIEETDLLLLEEPRELVPLTEELERLAPKVRRHIVLPDSPLARRAAEDFLAKSPGWVMHEADAHGAGLVCLRRDPWPVHVPSYGWLATPSRPEEILARAEAGCPVRYDARNPRDQRVLSLFAKAHSGRYLITSVERGILEVRSKR